MATIAYIITSDLSAATLLKGQLRYMREHGHRVVVFCADGPRIAQIREREGVEVVTLPFEREIDPLADARSLTRLVAELRRLKPDVVNASTAKAGLLGTLAATVLRIPIRVYTLRGLRYETTHGVKRAVLTSMERICARAATHVVAVSASVRERYLQDGFCAAEKIRVLGAGSSNGVDSARWHMNDERLARVSAIRSSFGIDPTTPVVGFVGRFVRDKGFSELVDAFKTVRDAVPDARLLLVGDYEDGDPVGAEVRARLASDPAVIHAGFVTDVAPYYALMNVLAFPSYREGFPNVPLEAACFGIPTVGFYATGTRDAVVDGITGCVVPMRDAAALAEGLLRYLKDDSLRRQHGQVAHDRAVDQFKPTRVWDALMRLYGA